MAAFAAAAVAFAAVAVRGGGGRRSDIALKHDIVLLGHLNNGLGFYRFAYNGSNKTYVGVMAQEVQTSCHTPLCAGAMVIFGSSTARSE